MTDNNTPAPPHNIEAEQALLGVILLNNDVMAVVEPLVAARDFYEPLHGRIFDRARELIAAGRIATPVSLKGDFINDFTMQELGGPRYLVRLAGAALSAFLAADYARIVHDCAARRRLIEAAQAMMERALTAPSETPATALIGEAETALAAVEPHVDGDRRSPLISWRQALVSALDDACRAYQGEDGGGIKTGIDPLDAVLGGFFPGEMIVIGGRPSMGKTALTQTIAMRAARAGRGVIFGSLEMQPSGIALRAISEHLAGRGVRAPYRDARLGDLSEDKMREFILGAAEIEDLPIYLTPPSIRSVDALAAAVRRAATILEKKGTPCGLIVFDYLQLADAAGANETERVGAISRSLKALASRLGVPVVAVSQLSRDLEKRDDKRPMLSDLRSSGQIEQDADVIMFTYRDEYYLERGKPAKSSKDYDARLLAWHEALEAARGKMEIIVAKQRMGDITTVEIAYDMATNSVADRRRQVEIEATAQEALL